MNFLILLENGQRSSISIIGTNHQCANEREVSISTKFEFEEDEDLIKNLILKIRIIVKIV